MSLKNTSVIKIIGIVILFLIGLALFLLLINGLKSLKNKNSDNVSLSTYQSILSDKPTIKIIDEKDSTLITKNKVLTISNQELEAFLKIENKKISELQKEISKYKKENELLSISLYETKIKLDNTVKTTVIKTDSLPVYNSMFELGYDKINKKAWVSGLISASSDSTNIKLSIHNRQSVIIGKNKKETYCDIISSNPYFDIDSVRVLNVELPKEKKYGLFLTLGYGIMTNNFNNLNHGLVLSLGYGVKIK